jgi:hypothetical protein
MVKAIVQNNFDVTIFGVNCLTFSEEHHIFAKQNSKIFNLRIKNEKIDLAGGNYIFGCSTINQRVGPSAD